MKNNLFLLLMTLAVSTASITCTKQSFVPDCQACTVASIDVLTLNSSVINYYPSYPSYVIRVNASFNGKNLPVTVQWYADNYEYPQTLRHKETDVMTNYFYCDIPISSSEWLKNGYWVRCMVILGGGFSPLEKILKL